MAIVQVFLDPSGDWIITGSVEFDSDNGAHLKLPQGTSFPSGPEAGDFFFRSDELKLYRYSGSAWQEQVAAIAAHKTTHEPPRGRCGLLGQARRRRVAGPTPGSTPFPARRLPTLRRRRRAQGWPRRGPGGTTSTT
jgi:hypothetical protein